MKVTLVTAFYNRDKYVQKSIQSLLDQTYENLEIIAIDDGSTDNTYKELCKFQDKRYKPVTQKNKGFVVSIIEAIKNSQSELIAIHGSGDIADPEKIQKQVNVIKLNPKYGITATYHTGYHFFKKKYIDEKRDRDYSIAFTDQLLKFNFICQGTILFRRDVYEKVGGYRSFFKFAQDYDLWLRMSFATELFVLPEILYERTYIPTTLSNDWQKVIQQKFFQEIIRQNADLIRNQEIDLVDKYGFYCPFFLKRSKRLSKSFTLYSLQLLFTNDNWKGAKEVLDISLHEKRNLLNTFAQILLFLTKFTIFRYFFKLLIKRIYMKNEN